VVDADHVRLDEGLVLDHQGDRVGRDELQVGDEEIGGNVPQRLVHRLLDVGIRHRGDDAGRRGIGIAGRVAVSAGVDAEARASDEKERGEAPRKRPDGLDGEHGLAVERGDADRGTRRGLRDLLG
jgi:hypothetical protein